MMLWTMKNGEEIAVKDMADSHVQNTINLLLRNVCPFPCLGGEMAQEEAEREYDRIEETRWGWIALFENEKQRREAIRD